eukprot:CAMPEP_0185762846 /NCGR_PEP_ID=MMETSP1174-20130828/21812_1 /TAXON_ID=35687 /ORGANISM="Dictyocha speculum, Strain CCMP1381" /LENGTH=53 /DNA_ID=CAMNT_0028444697 /DNA_START=986 /DNA_END=1147 /DNA_ORIENTATION=-
MAITASENKEWASDMTGTRVPVQRDDGAYQVSVNSVIFGAMMMTSKDVHSIII